MTITPSMGTCRSVAGAPFGGSQASCSRTSGEAFSRNQRRPSPLIAIDDCRRGSAAPGSLLATRQHAHQQFHWGKPPPAAVPIRTTCTRGKRGGAGSPAWGLAACRVGSHFKRDGHFLEFGLRPNHVPSSYDASHPATNTDVRVLTDSTETRDRQQQCLNRTTDAVLCKNLRTVFTR